MPITQWICQGCNGRSVPLDHFETTKCGELVHPDYVQAVWAKNSESSMGVRVTHGLGCPRRAAIEAAEGYALDPLEANAALTGTAWHALMEAHAPGWSEVEVKGKVAGVPMVGHIDRLRQPIIEDWKHISDSSLKYRKDEPAKPEHVAQLSIYAELCEQNGLKKPEKGIVWYHTSKNGKDALLPKPVGIMEIGWALRLTPYQGDYTVAELYAQSDSVFNKGADWRELPLAGSTMRFGNYSMCDFCSVREACTEASIGSPF